MYPAVVLTWIVQASLISSDVRSYARSALLDTCVRDDQESQWLLHRGRQWPLFISCLETRSKLSQLQLWQGGNPMLGWKTFHQPMDSSSKTKILSLEKEPLKLQERFLDLRKTSNFAQQSWTVFQTMEQYEKEDASNGHLPYRCRTRKSLPVRLTPPHDKSWKSGNLGERRPSCLSSN